MINSVKSVYLLIVITRVFYRGLPKEIPFHIRLMLAWQLRKFIATQLVQAFNRPNEWLPVKGGDADARQEKRRQEEE